MIKDRKASFSAIKIIITSLILIFCSTIAVMAFNVQVKDIKIVCINGEELSLTTTKNTVLELLEENHIVLLEDETVTPDINSLLQRQTVIRITKTIDAEDSKKADEIISNLINVEADELVDDYKNITEKVVTEIEVIPFETIIKETSAAAETTDNIIQRGVDGEKSVTYKIKYINDTEISREKISEVIIKEAVSQIIQKQSKTTSRSSGRSLKDGETNPALTASSTLAEKAAGKDPIIKTVSASAYTASTCGKSPDSPGYGKTASGAMASSWYTVAAGKSYPMGTIIYIPYFKDKPNGGWFVVQDRGGAITDNKLDVYMGTYNECISFGRRNLEIYIYM